MTIRKNQARSELALYPPGVTRQVELIVDRGDTEHLVPGTHLTMDEFHHYQLLGRRLQARAMVSAFGSLFKALVWPWRKLAVTFARITREAAAIRRLNSLDDHLLRDIGIRREHIPAAVAGLLTPPPRPRAAPASVVERPTERPGACNDPHVKAAA